MTRGSNERVQKTVSGAGAATDVVARLGLTAGQNVGEIGYDDDADEC